MQRMCIERIKLLRTEGFFLAVFLCKKSKKKKKSLNIHKKRTFSNEKVFL